MHLGNGAITPECGLVALGVAAAGCGVAYVSARAAGVEAGRARMAGALGAAVFAAQLFNVQIMPFSSVHLIGGVLLAWELGPALGLLTMAGILTLQACLLGDGGFLALGANIINMGLLPALAVAGVRRWQKQGRNTLLTVGATALAATIGAAGLVTLEVAAGRSSAQLAGWGAFATTMLGAHALAGVLEAAVSLALVASLTSLRKAGKAAQSGAPLSTLQASGIVAVSLLVAALSAPVFGLASTAPDGYEASLGALRQSGLALGNLDSPAQLSGIGAAVQQWQQHWVHAIAGPEVLLLISATLLAGIVAWGGARLCGRTPSRVIG